MVLSAHFLLMTEISFTSSELENLARAVHVADWVANSHAVETAEERLPLDEVRRKIYKSLNSARILEPWPEDPVTGRIFEPKEWEEANLREIVDPFSDEQVWNRIVESIADQVFEQLFGENDFSDKPSEKAEILASIENTIENRCSEGAAIHIAVAGWSPTREDFRKD